jgi:LmbE family N-acetylglucosaminyl deacetylase
VKVLAIGAHPDDIELGCGATLAAHRVNDDEITMLVMTTGEQGPQASGSRVHEQIDAAALLGAHLVWGGFDDCAVPEGRRAVDLIQSVIEAGDIDTIYTHKPEDSHQDHRATGQASLAAARRSTRVLLYESPTSDQFAPSIHVDIAAHLETKLALVRAHLSQVLKNGLVDLEAVEAQARYRGFCSRVRYAESFESARFAWPLGGATNSTTPVEIDLARELEDTIR